MKNSAERIQYITEYLISYKQKIEALNKNGLFDAATLYELFALEVCALWFGQKFSNLNSDTANFPYVDLISADGQLYVQVSTAQDIPAKVKKTLEKISDAKSGKISGVKQLFFFVLGNGSINSIKDYSGAEKIGNIDFVSSEHLITINNIIEKSKNNLEFQIGLYDVLYKESEFYNINALKLSEMLDLGKALVSKNIDNLINNEYEINREEIIASIKKDNHQFISIQGDAGAGKSALCKKLVLEEELVLYARAERFTEVTDLDSIWGISVCRTLKYLNGKRIIFFIDALEFIADGKKTKIELLQQLYELAVHNDNAFIITSCRTCDKTAFIKLEANYNIYAYQLPELTDEEIILVADKYPLIKEMWNLHSYTQLLRAPFYLNLIVSQMKSVDNITDVNELRNYIWQNIICLKNKQMQNDINTSDIYNAVNSIVFTRAKEFSTGISSESINSKILTLLISEGVITESENKVRLKYDVFEDICFEHFFDEKFDNCKGNYYTFFSEIESLGRCVYRRYQIWVENKLFAKNNREKFLYSLIAANIIPETWKQQTIIGMVKSRFCTDFFEEYGRYIAENNIKEFLKIVNMFSFETKIVLPKSGNSYTALNPIGYGRSCLIKLLRITDKYKSLPLKQDSVKICSDYARCTDMELETASAACEILEYYVENVMVDLNKEKIYSSDKIVNEYLASIYLMAEYADAWIKKFWEQVVADYKYQNNKQQGQLAEEIIENVLNHTTAALVKKLPVELCLLAETYWIYVPEDNGSNLYRMYHGTSMSRSEEYGLNDNADHYSYEFRSVDDNVFFWMLTKFNYAVALDWAIKMTNYVATTYKEKNPQYVLDIEIVVNETGQLKKYIGSPEFWLAGVQEHRIHDLIGDIIYILKQQALGLIENKYVGEQYIKRFAEYLKKSIYEKSNNIIMLTVIEEIGHRCSQVLPGYAIELASSIEIIMWDIQRVALLLPDFNRMLLEKQILLAMGIPSLECRYSVKKESVYTMQEYVMRMQMCKDEKIRLKAENVLDYLYSKIPDDADNAHYHLQIQKMDLRNAQIYKVNDNTFAISPQISGEAEKIVNNNQNGNFNIEQKYISEIVDECNKKVNEETFSTAECLAAIDRLYNIASSSDLPYTTEKILIMLISCALSKDDLNRTRRSELCRVWIDGINKIFNNNSFTYDHILSTMLFKQIEEELEDTVSVALKQLMLDCLLYHGQQGIISDIARYLKEYLPSNQKLARALFNTIVALSEDEMNHHVFNVNYAVKRNKKKPFAYIANRQQPPYWIDRIIKEKGKKGFKSKRDELISKYLMNEEELELINFDINRYDIATLCYVANCGLNLNTSAFYNVLNEIIINMIDIWHSCDDSHHFLDTYARCEVTHFFNKELTCSDDINLALDLLFAGIDYSKFTKEVYEFYEDIMLHFLPVFFDAYNNPSVRERCINNIRNVEKRLISITNEKVRTELSKIMFSTLGRFHLNDWNKLTTSFSYSDKCFLNDLWSKYGKNHPIGMLNVIHQMHIDELLPEVLVSVNNCFDEVNKKPDSFRRAIKEAEFIVNILITKAFLDFNDEIKQDEELTQAYENILETLMTVNFEEAAVLLDEFRVH
ncbi:SMEK domain-containing protein [Lacrimispora sp. BS-2]|uniref:SMEK domain-containing protein n=1 Tax=Lacrimispora sp. BS-2 TaxID=3151850 RepID=A0AAU7PPR6_9FIRM